MGNKAIICSYIEGETVEQFNKDRENELRKYANETMAVYLHWQGNEEKVRAFLMYCKFKGYRPANEDCYGWARLVQVISNYIGGELGIGIGNFYNFIIEDNGVYLIKNWEIKGKYYDDEWVDEMVEESTMLELIKEINKCQPVAEQIEEKELERMVNKEYSPSF